MQEGLKITLTRAALDRLIGGDKEMELILTHAAVQQVISDHLAVVKQHTESAIKSMIEESIGGFQRLWDSGKYVDRFVVGSVLSAAISEQIKYIIDANVHNFLQEKLVRSGKIRSMVTDLIDEKTDMWIKQEVERSIRKRIDAAVDAIKG